MWTERVCGCMWGFMCVLPLVCVCICVCVCLSCLSLAFMSIPEQGKAVCAEQGSDDMRDQSETQRDGAANLTL